MKKFIITENQNTSLKNKLKKLTSELGISKAAKAVGGIDNYVKILYKGNFNKFLNYLIKDLIENTSREYIIPYHYYLFDCNISVMLDHSRYPPIFAFTPSCFFKTMEDKYGIDKDTASLVWETYSKYVIQRYMNDKN